MSIRATRWAMDAIRQTDMPPTERLVLLVLAQHHVDASGECFPAVLTISGYVGGCERRVRQALRCLQSWNLIQVKRCGRPGANAANRYTLFGSPKKPAQTGKGLPLQTGTKKPFQTGKGVPPSNRQTVADERGKETEGRITQPEMGEIIRIERRAANA